jgi:uncharacterized phage infection (PIP) family protein YhgE
MVGDRGDTDRSNGHLRLVDPGTGAVLHGLMSMLSEVLDGLDRRFDTMEARLAALAGTVRELADAEPPAPPVVDLPKMEFPAIELPEIPDHREELQELRGAVERVEDSVAQVVDQVMEQVVERTVEAVATRMADLERAADERAGRIEAALAERISGIADALHAHVGRVEGGVITVQTTVADQSARTEAAVGRRMAQVEASIAEARAESEAAATRSGTRLATQLDEATGRLVERIGQAEQMAVGQAERASDALRQQLAELAARAETADETLAVQLAEVDAALAALRAETAGVPHNVTEQVQAALGSWRNRLRRGENDEPGRKPLDELVARIDRAQEHLSDGLSRVHDAVNRAQGESLEAAQTTTAEVRRLLDAARGDGERHVSEQLDAVAAVAERLVTVHEELNKRDGKLVDTLKQAADATTARIAEAEAGITDALAAALPAADDDDDLRRWLTDELTRLRDAVMETQSRAGTVAASVARQVDDVVQAAVTAVGDRVARERSTTDGIRRDVETVVARIEELTKSVAGARRDTTGMAQNLPELLRTVVREQESELGGAIESLQSAVNGLTASDKERADQGRAVLDAVANANQEHQEVLRALHSSLAKRFDARAKMLAETLDGLVGSLEVARTLGPSLDKVSARLDAQQPHLDQVRHQLVQLAAALTSVPADVERRHAEASAALDRVMDTLGGLRKHAASLDRAVQTMRTSQEGMVAAFLELRDGSTVLPQRLEQIATALDASRRQLVEMGESTRTVAGAMAEQQSMGNRLAELVTQVRAATRSDIERVESSIHLEVLKQHQQDQARLTQAVAGVSEVVEREAAVIAQRVSALASEVDAIHLELAGD